MPVNGRSWGFNVSESESDTHLNYMIDLALTTEFFVAGGGTR
jgi:hypothetical protein